MVNLFFTICGFSFRAVPPSHGKEDGKANETMLRATGGRGIQVRWDANDTWRKDKTRREGDGVGEAPQRGPGAKPGICSKDGHKVAGGNGRVWVCV